VAWVYVDEITLALTFINLSLVLGITGNVLEQATKGLFYI